MLEHDETTPDELNSGNDLDREQDSVDETEMIFSTNDFPVDVGTSDDSVHQQVEVAAENDGQSAENPIEEWTLADLLAQFWRAPKMTWALFRAIVQADYSGRTVPAHLSQAVQAIPAQSDSDDDETSHGWRTHLSNLLAQRNRVRLTLFSVAILASLLGNLILSSNGEVAARRSEAVELAAGAPFLLLGFFLWILAESFWYWPEIKSWWTQKDRLARVFLGARCIPIVLILFAFAILWDSTDAPREMVLDIVIPGINLLILGAGLWVLIDAVRLALPSVVRWHEDLFPSWVQESLQAHRDAERDAEVEGLSDVDLRPWYMRIHLSRPIFALAAMILSTITWFGTAQNQIPTPIFYSWLGSALLWSLAFAPLHWNPLKWASAWQKRLQRWRRACPAYRWVVIIFAIIAVFGLAFRFTDIATHPREMTDDHVEKILDSGLVRDGLRAIFFANNGGREPFQMYAIALFSHLPGMGINHLTIKVLAAIESMLTLPFLFWMGYEVFNSKNQRLRILVSLLLTALVAVSYWHVAISRQGLRIVLMPLITSVLIIYLTRALRHNRRADFIKTGLALGFGLYMYQAVRILPVVIVVAVAIGVYFGSKNWRQRWRYVLNLLVLVWISFMVFLPMFHYSLDFPELFWRRTTGRLLGDDIIEETLEDGTKVLRDASLDERLQAFQDNVPVLMNNIRNVLLMFNWKGDVATINGVPNQPALDILMGTFLIVGLAAWLVLMIRQRDMAHWLLAILIFIMLLPSALSIAFPVENPSHTRTSGALPGVYLIIALPLGILVDRLLSLPRKRVGQFAAIVFSAFIIIGSYNANTHTYFAVYPQVYADTFDPYSEPGRFLRGFAESHGSYGNAFLIGFPHWWSHRAIGLAAGLEEKWPNGIEVREALPAMLAEHAQRLDRFRFDPEKDILFFYSPDDTEAGELLRALFPQGRANLYQTYQENDNFMWYLVPALGRENFQEWLSVHNQPIFE